MSRSVLSSTVAEAVAFLKISASGLGALVATQLSVPPWSGKVIRPNRSGGPGCNSLSRSVWPWMRPRTTRPSWMVSGTSAARPKLDCSGVIMCAGSGAVLVTIAVLALHLQGLRASE